MVVSSLDMNTLPTETVGRHASPSPWGDQVVISELDISQDTPRAPLGEMISLSQRVLASITVQ